MPGRRNSFRPKGNSDDAEPPPGRNAERNFRGEKRSNETHASVTDPDVRLYRKGDGQSSRLCFMGHLLMENRNALIIDATLTHATGTAERDAALVMLDRRKRRRRITLGADKAYDVSGFVDELRARKTTPHIAIDGHLTKAAQDKDRPPHHPPFGLYREPAHAKAHRGELRLDQDHLAKTRHRGLDRVGWMFTLAAAACNLVRLPKLLTEAVP